MSDLYKNIEAKKVSLAVFSEDSNNNQVTVLDTNGEEHSVNLLQADLPTLVDLFRKNGVRFAVKSHGSKEMTGFLSGLASMLIPFTFLSLMFFSFRNGGINPINPSGGMGGLQNMGNLNLEGNTGVSFADVAGCDESKLELMEIVDFLKYPQNFTDIGAVSPRGVLLEGPPGTGKTLLARAVAGEANVNFISTTGSEFVEVYVGVGASRVRKMFKDAKKNSPCIIFIDEIDSIGRSRSGGGPGSNDERDQTLNQILAEMDGFSGNTGIIVLAATNRADILDSALLRPGRFDRRVPVGLPSKSGRYEILKVHTRDKPLDNDVDLDEIAGRTIGFSGASLKNLMNEAAIVAVRNGKQVIGYDEIDYAIDRITVGIQKPIGPNVRKELVAYHEAGHAIMAALIPGYDNVAKVTIIPRTNGAGGFTLFTPSEERMESGLYSQNYLKSQLCVALGGRVAEELIYGEDEITTGASGDLQSVRDLARRMVTQWGFRNNTSIDDFPIAWEPSEPIGYGGNSLLSSDTENEIDYEITMIVKHAYEVCKKTLSENMEILEGVKNALIDKETITGKEVEEIIKKYKSNV
jgi:cell division protease FtsH